MEIKIEKNVPMPGEWMRQQNGRIFPADKILAMEIGDSFMLTKEEFISPSAFRTFLYKIGKENKMSFVTRKNKNYDIRVWRIA